MKISTVILCLISILPCSISAGVSVEKIVPIPNESFRVKYDYWIEHRFTEPYVSDQVEIEAFLDLILGHAVRNTALLGDPVEVTDTYVLPAVCTGSLFTYVPGRLPMSTVTQNFFPIDNCGGLIIISNGISYDSTIYLVKDESYVPLSTEISYEERRKWDMPRYHLLRKALLKQLKVKIDPAREDQARIELRRINEKSRKLYEKAKDEFEQNSSANPLPPTAPEDR